MTTCSLLLLGSNAMWYWWSFLPLANLINLGYTVLKEESLFCEYLHITCTLDRARSKGANHLGALRCDFVKISKQLPWNWGNFGLGGHVIETPPRSTNAIQCFIAFDPHTEIILRYIFCYRFFLNNIYHCSPLVATSINQKNKTRCIL